MINFSKKRRALISILLTLIIISVVITGFGVGDINEAKQDLGNIQHELDKVANELKQKQNLKDYYESLSKNMKSSMDSQELQLATYNEYIREITEEVNSLTDTIEKAELEYENKLNIIKKRIVDAYIQSNVPMMEVLFNSSSLKDYFDYLELSNLIAQHDKELIDDIKVLIKDINDKRLTMEMLKSSYTTLSEQAEIVLSNMKEMEESAAATVSATGATIAVLKARENQLAKEEAEMLNVILKLQREIDYIGGQMTWPLPSWRYMPTGNGLFGWRYHPIFFEWRMHNGVDLGGVYGNNIIAANDGVVSIATWSDGYGYYVAVDHGGGVSTLYAHASKLLVSAGQSVKKGEVIALIGATGWATGPHLHFEVIVGGKRVDPLLYVDPSR